MLLIHLRCALRLLLLLAGFSGHPAASALASPDTDTIETRSPDDRLRYDQLSARVPRELAPIASVALTRVNIAMHQAKQLAEQRLCAGRWTPQGAILFEVGPLLPQPRDTKAEDESWAYQAFRLPEGLSCGEVNRARFFQELSRHLPEWITIRPGGQAAAFQRGNPVASN